MSALPLRPTREIVEHGRSVLPLELVSEDSYARLVALAPHLPHSILVGLECRLREDDEPVDLWICPGLSADELSQSVSWMQRQGWSEFAPLANCLQRGQVPWPCASGAWTTEFDLGSWDMSSKMPPIPSSFVTFGSTAVPLPLIETITTLWEGERSAPMPASELEQLREILAQCPRGELAGWGFLYPRPSQPARLMLRVYDLQDFALLLGPKVQTAQRLLDGLTSQIVIGTPLHYEEEKRQNIEAYIKGPEEWKELAQRLVAQGYATPAKAEAMTQMALAPRVTANIIGTLNHVKLALKDSGEAEVKAYPSLFTRP